MNSVVLKQVETSVSILTLHESGIGQMHFKDRSTIDIMEQAEHLEGLKKLTDNKKTPFVVTAGSEVTFTKESRDHAIMIEHLSPVCANAVVVGNLAYRLIADFYMKIQRPKTPFRVFTDKQKAFAWCAQFLHK